jgi:NADH dehydrogenase [ubiquinone] 1 alpha subcomplex assembly factor 5
MRILSRGTGHRTSAAVSSLFDMELRALRRDRAARMGPELFLFERAFADCLERLALVPRRFDRALLIGCPDAEWPKRLGEFARSVNVRDPGPLFAGAAGGETIIEDAWTPTPDAYDLVFAIGTLDTVNDLPRALMAIRLAMVPDGFFLGAISGGDTLPRLRAAMRAADAEMGAASPHVHPRIEAAAVAPLLSQCGFANPVIDVDRAQASYGAWHRLVDDLRRMGANNLLSQRSRQLLSRRAVAAAAKSFADAAEDGRTPEIFEILHFACWVPTSGAEAREG